MNIIIDSKKSTKKGIEMLVLLKDHPLKKILANAILC